jgi:hypothetical protein
VLVTNERPCSESLKRDLRAFGGDLVCQGQPPQDLGDFDIEKMWHVQCLARLEQSIFMT